MLLLLWGGIIMIQYKKILVPVDASPTSARALQHAVAIALAHNAEIILLNVANIISAVSNFDQGPIIGARCSEQVAKDLEESGHEITTKMRELIPSQIKVEEVLQVGTPGPVIIDVAKQYKVDLVVMGSRGYGMLKGIILGSVSTYVAKHEEYPVLIVK